MFAVLLFFMRIYCCGWSVHGCALLRIVCARYNLISNLKDRSKFKVRHQEAKKFKKLLSCLYFSLSIFNHSSQFCRLVLPHCRDTQMKRRLWSWNGDGTNSCSMQSVSRARFHQEPYSCTVSQGFQLSLSYSEWSYYSSWWSRSPTCAYTKWINGNVLNNVRRVSKCQINLLLWIRTLWTRWTLQHPNTWKICALKRVIT